MQMSGSAEDDIRVPVGVERWEMAASRQVTQGERGKNLKAPLCSVWVERLKSEQKAVLS